MLRDVDLGKGHQVHVPLVEVVQGWQARERNGNEHVEQESQIPGLDRKNLSPSRCTLQRTQPVQARL